MGFDDSDPDDQSYRERYGPEGPAVSKHSVSRQLTVRDFLDMEVMARVKPNDPVYRDPKTYAELARTRHMSKRLSSDRVDEMRAVARAYLTARHMDLLDQA